MRGGKFTVCRCAALTSLHRGAAPTSFLRGAKFTVLRCVAVGSLLPPRGALRRCAAASSLFVAALTSLHRGAAPTSLLRGANFSYIRKVC